MQTHGSEQGSERGSEHWLVLAAAVAMWVGLLVLGWLVEPDPAGHGTHEQLGLPPCLLMEVAGVPCPGCGVTTSVSLAAQGRVAESWSNQPLGLLVAVLGALSLPWALWVHLTGRNLWRELRRLANRRVIVVVLLFVLAAWGWKLYLEFGA